MDFLTDYMSTNPVMVGPLELAQLAAEEAERRNVRHVIVTDGRAVIGVASTEGLKAVPPDVPVAAVMNGNVVVVNDQGTINEAETLMDEADVDCLPVTHWDDLIVGVLTRSDVARCRAEANPVCSACGACWGTTDELGTGFLCPSCSERSRPPLDSIDGMYITLGGGD